MKTLKTFLAMAISIGMLNLLACSDESTLNPVVSDFEQIQDYEDIQTPTKGKPLVSIKTVKGDSPDAVFINRCNDIWNNITITKYTNNDGHVIDDVNGIYKYDCSGFIGRIVIESTLPDHYNDLQAQRNPIINSTGTGYMYPTRPLVATFYDYFTEILGDNPEAENESWKVFTSFDQLKKGDMIIARYNDDWRVDNTYSSTGHMMVAWNIGRVSKNGEVEIQVMDATASAHTASMDTRVVCDVPVAELVDGKPSGIGFGYMKYKITDDAEGKAHAYKWSLTSTYWYNLVTGDDITEPLTTYNRLDGIIFARAK